MKLYLIVIITTLLILPAVTAADFTTTFNRNYTLSINVDVGGVAATAYNTQCNATVKDTLGRYLKYQDNMSIEDNGDAKIDLNASSLRVIGEYPYKISCISGGSNNTISGSIETTSDGERDNNNNYMILFLTLGAFLLLGFGISNENYIFGFISGILFFLSSIFIYQFGLFSFQDLYSQGIAGVMLIMGLWANVGAVYTAIEDMGVRYS